MRIAVRSFALAVTAVGLSSAAVAAQGFNFSTTGFFTSAVDACSQAGPGAMTVTCADPGSSLSLTFTGRNWTAIEPLGFESGSIVTMGDFLVSGLGSATAAPGSVLFTLVIHQSGPTPGMGSTTGSISGSIRRQPGLPAFSSLVWRPSEVVNVEPVVYDLVFRTGLGGVPLAAAGMTTIEAVGTVMPGTVVPEPATMLLLGSGLVGVLGARRRRRSVDAA